MNEYTYDISKISRSFEHKGKVHKIFDYELAVAHLLLNHQLIIFNSKFIEEDWDGLESISKSCASMLSYNCSDVFAWGCCDDEPVPISEIKNLFLLWHEDKGWGSIKWVCKRRNMQPQQPIVKDMKEQGKWCELMESLPKNTFDY